MKTKKSRKNKAKSKTASASRTSAKPGSVGYGKPPVATRFKKGVSGNPAGRPRGSRNFATDLIDELDEKITVRVDGRPYRISTQRALIKTLKAKALGGDQKAAFGLLAQRMQIETNLPEDEHQNVEADEIEIVRRYAPRLLKKADKK